MALDLPTRLRMYLASAPANVRAIQVLELSHPAMSRVWHLWAEPYVGQVTVQDPLTLITSEVEVLPINLEIDLAGSEGNLDQVYEITLDTVDNSDEFGGEMDRIPLDTNQRVRAVYREYLSDDLTEAAVTALLQVESVSSNAGAATISAISPRLNITRTGEIYAPRDVPMLRSFT
ncbi:DUF1833 family protein [Variovorax sp. DAIF25]|uniref:DUF1833 family protein n=1 Tax=Variovorax sp. DAIF25 TaxID=3080983 RepID=UPI003D6B4245